MKDIIEQIIEIDSLAFGKNKNTEEFLKNKREEYENELNDYRETNIKTANLEAEKIISQGMNVQDADIVEERVSNINKKIEIKYSQLENDLVKMIFNKIFAMEN